MTGASLCVILLGLGVVTHARAADPSAALGEAEANVASAEGDIAQAESELDPAQGEYEASARKALPADRAAAGARREARRAKTSLIGAQQRARRRIAAMEADHERAVEDHDETVKAGVAFGLTALVVVGIVLGWSWIRASGPVAWLAERPLGQVIGICVFGGFLALVFGAAMLDVDGAVGVLGGLVLLLAFILPVAVLLVRHSALVRAGRSKPLTGRESLPVWVSRTTAGVAGLLFLIGIGSAIFTSAPQALAVPAGLRSAAAPTALVTPALAQAERRAATLEKRATDLDASRAAARRRVEAVRRELRQGKRRLARAEGDAARYSRRLTAITERETREAEEAEAEAIEEESESAGCDSNYVGACLDPAASDYDCSGGSGDGPEYTGPVQVVGVDHYGLDADGDGYACEE